MYFLLKMAFETPHFFPILGWLVVCKSTRYCDFSHNLNIFFKIFTFLNV